MVHYLMRKVSKQKFSSNACNAFLEFSSHTQAWIEEKKGKKINHKGGCDRGIYFLQPL